MNHLSWLHISINHILDWTYLILYELCISREHITLNIQNICLAVEPLPFLLTIVNLTLKTTLMTRNDRHHSCQKEQSRCIFVNIRHLLWYRYGMCVCVWYPLPLSLIGQTRHRQGGVSKIAEMRHWQRGGVSTTSPVSPRISGYMTKRCQRQGGKIFSL